MKHPKAPANSKCACPQCHCAVPAGKGFVRQHRTYCSETCAYECTSTTCVCVHDRCGSDPHKHHPHQPPTA